MSYCSMKNVLKSLGLIGFQSMVVFWQTIKFQNMNKNICRNFKLFTGEQTYS